MSRVPNQWTQFEYHDPDIVLPRLRIVKGKLSWSDAPYAVKNLRTNKLKRHRESWDAAILCYLVSRRFGHKYDFSIEEQSDFDFVFRWHSKDTTHYAPVQLKELIPDTLNPNATLQSLLDGLTKYVDSSDLIVGVRLNRRLKIDLSTLVVDHLNIRQLWLFGSVHSEKSTWALIGDVLIGDLVPNEYEIPHA